MKSKAIAFASIVIIVLLVTFILLSFENDPYKVKNCDLLKENVYLDYNPDSPDIFSGYDVNYTEELMDELIIESEFDDITLKEFVENNSFLDNEQDAKNYFESFALRDCGIKP